MHFKFTNLPLWRARTLSISGSHKMGHRDECGRNPHWRNTQRLFALSPDKGQRWPCGKYWGGWLPLPWAVPLPPPLPILQLLMKSSEMGTRMQRQSGFNSFWASARFSLGPGHVSQCWFPWLIYPKSALPETLAFVLPVAVFKWGFGWEQYQTDRHYTPIIMKLMGSKSFWLKALTGWDHIRL